MFCYCCPELHTSKLPLANAGNDAPAAIYQGILAPDSADSLSSHN